MNTEIMKKLEAWLDEHFDELVEDIKRIVSVPSVSNAGDGSGYPFGSIDGLKEQGYDGGLIAEIFNCDGEHMLASIAKSIEWIKSVI